MKLTRTGYLLGISLFVCVALGQIDRAQRTNPASSSEIALPADVSAVLHRACYDCHSNQTVWPWYGEVFPISRLTAYNVTRGRTELNFSEWGSYPENLQLRKLLWSGRVLKENSMPPWDYLLLHPASRLSSEEKGELGEWINAAAAELKSKIQNKIILKETN